MRLPPDCQLFTWGENSRGQLGLGRGAPSFLTPQPLTSLCGIPLAQISAGGQHSLALSLSGAVFGWGSNQAGQLGLGDTAGIGGSPGGDITSLKAVCNYSRQTK